MSDHRWFGRRRILGIAVSVAGLAVSSVFATGSGRGPMHFRPLLRASAGHEAELAWPSGSWSTARSGSLLARTASRTLSVGRKFTGSTSAETSGDPPDPVVGVGSGFVVQMVNSAVRIWTTEGIERATYPLATFIGAASADVSDPQVVFDPASRRWFASAVDIARPSVQIAVSAGSDPTGRWTIYSHSTGSCPDQPSLGVGRRLVVVGYGAFTEPCRSAPPPTYLGGALFVYDKEHLLDGTAADAVDWGPRLGLSPVATAGVTGSPARALALATPSLAGGPTFLAIISLEPQPTITRLPIRALIEPPPAEQAGTSREIDTNDVRILSAVVLGRTLWLAGNEGCVAPADGQLRSCLRLIAVTGNRISLDKDIGSAGRDVFYPALAANHGDVVVVHGFSSRSEYPGIAVFAIVAGNRRTRELTIAEGAGPDLSDRFGDYFAAATDTGGRTWVTGETGLLAGGPAGSGDEPASNWATTVASVSTQPDR